MIRKKALFISFLALCALAPQATAQWYTPMEALGAFFDDIGKPENEFRPFFTSKATITSIYYDSAGTTNYRTVGVDAFEQEIKALQSDFEVRQEPVVLIYREYGSIASIYTSIWMQFVDKQSSDTLIAKSVQSIRLIKLGDSWRIHHIAIQNEHPSQPLSDDLWPEELTNSLLSESRFAPPASEKANSASTFAEEVYDDTRIYQLDEVDEPPTYPSDPETYQTLLNSFDVIATPSPGYSPFLVVIKEDGSVELSNTEALSSYQRTRAKSFARSMLMWYPAIRDAASVKCYLTFYIRA